jgi:hypothetical protein
VSYTLKCDTLRVKEYPDMIDTPLRSMINRGSGKPCCSLCIPRNSSLIPSTQYSIPFVSSYYILSKVRSPISPYRCSPLSYPHIVIHPCLTSLSTHFMTLHTPWPSHMLASSYMQLSLSGPRVSICHMDGKSRSWFTLLYLLLWHTQETPFQSLSYVMTVDAIKSASRRSD